MNIKEISNYLESKLVDPLPRYIFYKEVLKYSDEKLIDIYHQVQETKWYLNLKNEQVPNGSWGRFHSQDTKLKEKRLFLTTESALRRCRDLGLDKNDEIVKRCITLMENYLKNIEKPTDRIEKHYGFEKALQTIVAANLSLFDSNNSLLFIKRKICAENMIESFKEGYLDKEIWAKLNREKDDIYLEPFMVYIIWLLANNRFLPEEIERLFLHYLWNRKGGIYYVSDIPPVNFQGLESRYFDEWLRSLEELAYFSLFPKFMEEGIKEHLLNEVNRLINHEINLPPTKPIYGRYSNRWINNNRVNDLILRILRLLMKC